MAESNGRVGRGGPAGVWVIVLRRPAGRLILRLEHLSTSNGPDLRVYLSRVPADGDLHAYRTGYIDLGALKGKGRHGPLERAGSAQGRYLVHANLRRPGMAAIGVAVSGLRRACGRADASSFV
jgi:hypothetical protein